MPADEGTARRLGLRGGGFARRCSVFAHVNRAELSLLCRPLTLDHRRSGGLLRTRPAS